MGLDNLMELLESRLEEAKLWKKIIEKPVIRKQSEVADRVNEKIKAFAKAQVDSLEKCTNGIREEVSVEAFREDLAVTAKPAKTEKKAPKPAPAKIKPKTTPHRERKKMAEVQKDYTLETGQEVKILTTESITAVNNEQASKFIVGDKVKVARVYTNQYDDDVVEIIKQSDSGLVKAVISLEDIEH